MRVCCGCQTNTSDAYYPTTCECIAAHKDEDGGAFFCALSNNAPNKCYFDGLCLGCWNKMFEPTFVPVPAKRLLYRKIRSNKKRLEKSSLEGKRYRRFRPTIYVKQNEDPKCKWCNVPFDIIKYEDMDYFPIK